MERISTPNTEHPQYMDKYDYGMYITCMRHVKGEAPKFSTGLCGGITAGYGELDEHGYWEYPLPYPIIQEILKGVDNESL